jgi:predicted RNA-binding protein YlxR (DUF448 family)
VAPKQDLVRLARVFAGRKSHATATIDQTGTLPGRGAYVCRAETCEHPSRGCMKLATRTGTLQRAFRGVVEVPVELLESESR